MIAQSIHNSKLIIHLVALEKQQYIHDNLTGGRTLLFAGPSNRYLLIPQIGIWWSRNCQSSILGGHPPAKFMSQLVFYHYLVKQALELLENLFFNGSIRF